MIDLPRSGPCRHRSCGRRAIRAGLCLEHLETVAPGPLPWPDDLQPVKANEYALRKRLRLAHSPAVSSGAPA